MAPQEQIAIIQLLSIRPARGECSWNDAGINCCSGLDIV